jgi:copper chaperone CopZ
MKRLRAIGRLTAGMAAFLLFLAAPAAAGPGKQGFQETTIAVSGMFCSSCAATVELALKNVDGVAEARADLKADQVRVRYDGKKVTPRRMAEAIRRAGYRARLPGEAAR